MKLKRFARLLDSYGSNPERWPEDERDAALALLAASTEAGDLRDLAQPLDQMLDHSIAGGGDDALRARIMTVPYRHSTAPEGQVIAGRWKARTSSLGLWPRMAAMAAACVLGFVAGISDIGVASNLEPEADLGRLILGDQDLDG